MLGMATQGKRGRPKKAEPKIKGRSPACIVYARIDQELGEVFSAHIESIEPQTTLTAVLEMAVREYLAKRGLWPPTDDDDAGE